MDSNEARGAGQPATTTGPGLAAEEIRRQVADVPYWWHSIDVGQGVVTPGLKWGGDAGRLRQELESLHLPPLAGKTVLDIGAYDGYYSFEAERQGAARVVALDHMVWLNLCGGPAPLLDFSLSHLPPDGLPPPGSELPGKRAFDTAHRLLGSRVESVVADFMYYDLEKLGTFDVVLYLGILYHMEEPLTALRRVAQVTGELAVIESEIMEVPGWDEHALAEFIPDHFKGDRTNWWIPNVAGLTALAQAAGFRRVELVDKALHMQGAPPPDPERPTLIERARRSRIAPAARKVLRPVRPLVERYRWRPSAQTELFRGRATLHAWK